jgi:hypothetical protein
MSLKFTNRRFIPALDYNDPVKVKGPWLDATKFSETEKEQLKKAMLLYDGREIDDEELFSGGYDTFEGMCEVPLEWWDVADDEGVVRYQLWIYNVDSGSLFINNSLDTAGEICQFYFQSDDPELAMELQQAKDELSQSSKDSEIISVNINFR